MRIIRTARTGASAARSLHRHRHKLRDGEQRREGFALIATDVGHEPLKMAAEAAAVAGAARLVAGSVAAGTIAAGGATAVAAPVVAGVAAAYATGMVVDKVRDRYTEGDATVAGDVAKVRRVVAPAERAARGVVGGVVQRFAPQISAPAT